MADAGASIQIAKASLSDIPTINSIAKEVWPVAYRDVITAEQIEYMLERMYSSESLQQQMTVENCTFYILHDTGRPMGFASFSEISPAVFKLHKLYVISTSQKRGYGSHLLDKIFGDITEAGGGRLQLQVNKKNSAITFYKKIGFEILEEAVFDIGHGFVMDDYIMVKEA